MNFYFDEDKKIVLEDFFKKTPAKDFWEPTLHTCEACQCGDWTYSKAEVIAVFSQPITSLDIVRSSVMLQISKGVHFADSGRVMKQWLTPTVVAGLSSLWAIKVKEKASRHQSWSSQLFEILMLSSEGMLEGAPIGG